MFFRRDKDNPDSKARPTPSWFKLLVLGFLIYALVQHVASRDAPSSGDLKKDALNVARDLAFPEQLQGVTWRDEGTGKGPPALCGQHITISYRTMRRDGSVIEDMAEPRNVTLGQAGILPAINQVAVGLAKGAKRSFYAAPEYAYRSEYGKSSGVDEAGIVSGELEIVDVVPRDISPMPLHATTLRKGDSGANCGEIVQMRINAWDANGNRLDALKGQPVEYRLGENTLPTGLVLGLAGAPGSDVAGIALNEIRTIVIPPALLKIVAPPAADTDLAKIRWPKSGVVTVDVERVK